jgi:hypothetical protein
MLGKEWREKNVFSLRYHILYLYDVACYRYNAQVVPWADNQGQDCAGECATYSSWNSREDFYTNESFACLIKIN